MLRNIFRASVSEGIRRNVSTQCELDVTPNAILWSQTENIFSLIENGADNFLRKGVSEDDNFKLHEDRLDFFYQLLGTVIVEKNTEQFLRKVEIDCKLAHCRYKLEKIRNSCVGKTEKTLEEELRDMLTMVQNLQKTNTEISRENAETIHNIRKILVVLAPKSGGNDTSNSLERNTSFSFIKQGETNILYKLKTLQSFWSTIFNNLQPTLSKEIRESAQHILQALNIEIVLKLKELHVESDDDPPVSLSSFSSDPSTDFAEDEDDSFQPFKDPERMHTFETLQIARQTIRLKNKIGELLEELNNYDDSKYDKCKKILEKCQDGFEDIQSHCNPDLVALRTETFNMLLSASRTMNEIYEERLFKSNFKSANKQ